MGEGGGGRRERKGWMVPVKASVSGVSLLQLSPFFASIFPLFPPKRLILRLGWRAKGEKRLRQIFLRTPSTPSFAVLRSCCYQHEKLSFLSISPSLGVRGKEVLEKGGGGEGREKEAWPKTFVSLFPPPLKSLLRHGPCFTDSSHEGFSLAVSLLLKYNVLKSLDQNLAPKKSNAEFPTAKGKSSDYIY